MSLPGICSFQKSSKGPKGMIAFMIKQQGEKEAGTVSLLSAPLLTSPLPPTLGERGF
jgi:hypothetical protein